MKFKRRGRVDRVKPTDFGLDELSKINKDNVVRVMDRSRERTGEKLSDESGLYVPKRDPYYYDVERFSTENISKRKILSEEREDYNYGKVFAVGEQYLDRDTFSSHDDTENYSYDDYDDFNEYSVSAILGKEKKAERKPASYNEKYKSMDQAEKLREKALSYKRDDFEENIREEADEQSALYEAAAEDNSMGFEPEFSAEEADEQSALYEVAAEDNSMGFEPEFSPEKAEDRENDEADEVQKEQDLIAARELERQKEERLMEAIEKMEGSVSPKEKLAAQREAIRLGMADVLVDSDSSDMVRPELLDEMGFTPGGEKEPEIVKNKRFRFGRKKKEKQNKAGSQEEGEVKTHAPAKESDKLQSDLEAKEIHENKRNREEAASGKSIASKQVKDSEASDMKKTTNGKAAEPRERRSEAMRDPEKRADYIRKNKEKLDKAGNDLMQMQEKYENLTECLNDIVILDELPDEVVNNIRNTAGMVVRYRNETEKTKKESKMDETLYNRMNQDKDELPDIIKRLTDNEKYADKLKNDIDRIEEEKENCQDEREETEYNRNRTKNISIAVMVVTVITMIILIVLQVVFEFDVQIPILLFGVCAILETLGIFVQYFRSETDETTNHYKLNKLIKKQNAQKVKYVNTINAVEFVYKKYHVHSSSELLFQWENFQRTVQAREDFKIAGNEVIYYEDRLKKLLEEYGFKNSEIWVTQAEFLVEDGELGQMKDKMAKRRSKLMERMEKCKRVMGKLDSELNVLVIKYPQYAEEIRNILKEI